MFLLHNVEEVDTAATDSCEVGRVGGGWDWDSASCSRSTNPRTLDISGVVLDNVHPRAP